MMILALHALGKVQDHEAESDNDAMHLAKAATIVHRDMLKMKQHFDGSFESKCQEDSVSASLALVSMVLNGPSIKQQSVLTTPQHVLTIAQLLMHNSMIRCRDKKTTATVKHNRERETPLPIYLDVMIHTKTRKWELVDQLFDLGLSVSYDRAP